MTGCLLGIAFMRHRRTSSRYYTAVEDAVIGTVIAAIVASRWLPLSLQYSLFMMPFWGALISVFVVQQGLVSRILTHPTFVRLGEVSFSFYLIHLTVIRIMRSTLGVGNAGYSFMLAMTVSLAAAFALFHWVETPLRRCIRGTTIFR